MNTKLCKVCKEEKSLDKFYKNKLGYFWSPCKDCNIIRSTRIHKELRNIILNHYSNGTPECACCGEKQLEFLCIDHVDNNGSAHRKEFKCQSTLYRNIIKNKFKDNLQILCYNCNQSKGTQQYCPHEVQRRLLV